LTSNEAENALARCLVRKGGFCEEMLGIIKDEKASIVKKSEVLTYIPEDQQASREEIGGFDMLLSWVDRRRLAYSRDAQEKKIDYPKGVVLIGIPGTGKSYVAAAVARLLGLPGYIMDIGSVFGSLVGESEQRMRDAIRQIEAQQGCVLLLDEADKAFGGATDSQGDSGVTRRVFGQLLTWLAAKQDRTFVIMTLNRTKGIPPEFLRAGRFDAVFWTDLPHEIERRQILDIHLKKRGVEPGSLELGDAEWVEVVQATNGYVGAEIEQIVKEARYISYERRQVGEPTFEEIIEAKESIIPIGTLEQEKVNEIREWCKNRAKNVSSPPPSKRQPRTRAVDVGG
jgi:SpoVK/Ycf46/Vps4 family AAA+-type ATPase